MPLELLMMDTGLSRIFVKANMLLEGTANKVMTVKGLYLAMMNGHTQLYEGMLVLWWHLKIGVCKKRRM